MEWQEVIKNVWDFEQDKELIGVLIRKPEGQFGGNDFILEVKEKGEVLIYGKTVLQNKMNDLKEGTVIKIEYLGKVTSPKTRRTYEDFRVYQMLK
jgi:hypothetical protein